MANIFFETKPKDFKSLGRLIFSIIASKLSRGSQKRGVVLKRLLTGPMILKLLLLGLEKNVRLEFLSV